MDIENVSRIGFTARRPAQQKRDLTMDRGVPGQIVNYQQHVAPSGHEVLRHSAGGIRSQPLKAWRGIGLANDKKTTFRRAIVADCFNYLCDGRCLLANSCIDAYDIGTTLVNDSVNGDCSFAGPSVADNKFPLAAPERNHRVYNQKTGCQRSGHQRAINDRGRRLFNRCEHLGDDRLSVIKGHAEPVDDAAEQRLPNWDTRDFTSGAHNAPGRNPAGLSQ